MFEKAGNRGVHRAPGDTRELHESDAYSLLSFRVFLSIGTFFL
jgi:hypothetical protein